MNITWTLRWTAVRSYIRLFSRIFWFSIRLFIQNWIFIILNILLNRLLWNHIICNKISQYWINFDWLSFFFEFNTITITWNCFMNWLWKMSMFDSIRVFLHSLIHTKFRRHFFFCQLNLHWTISTILFSLFNDSRSSRIQHVKKSWRFVDHYFIQTSFNSSCHCWKLCCFKSFFFRHCFLMKTIKVEVKSIYVNSRTNFFTEHQFLIFKIWKKIRSRCRKFDWI